MLLSVALYCNAESTNFSCTSNWCGEKWRKTDRILVYNYTEEVENVTFLRNTTITRKNCTIMDLLLSPNTDRCKTVNITKTETITFQVTSHKRSTEPEIRELPKELTLGIIATENVDIFGNQSRDAYSELEDKVWQIWVPRSCRLVMFFSEFDLESSPNCSKDYFTIQSTKRQAKIPKYCGGISSAPKDVQITKRRAQFHFHSDSDEVRSGIRATYCFQKNRDVDPNDVLCNCNADTSSLIKKRHVRSRSNSDSTKSGSNSNSKKNKPKKKKMSKKEMRRLMAEQDRLAGQGLHDMMKYGLKAINEYKYSSNKAMRMLAEKYQAALDMSLV